MSALLIALLAGIGAYAVFVLAVPKAVPEDKQDNVRNALDRLYEENRASEAAEKAVVDDQLQEEPAFVRTVFGLPFTKPLYEAGLRAGYQGNFQQLLMIALGSALLIVFGATYIGQGLIGLVLGPPGGYVLAMRQCTGRVKSRNRKLLDQFPDALDMIVRSVRSGFPLSVALQMLAQNAEDPLREEFRHVVDDVALGRTLSQALARLASRIDESDIRFFVVVLNVQQETGGNLAEIIGNLSNILRKRKQLRHKIRAMTSEGRATGMVLGSLPIVVYAALSVIQPDYLKAFYTDQAGMIMLGSVGALLLTCFFVVKQMINVEI